MHVLIIGGTGYVGSRLVDRLLARHMVITVLAKEPMPGLTAHVRVIIGDRSDPNILTRLAQLKVDAVVDLIAYRPQQTRELVNAFAGRIRCYVHLSTIAVYAHPFTFPLQEDQATLVNNGGHSYSNLKADCERVLTDAYQTQRFPMVILRSTPIMGPSDPVSREVYMLKRLLRKKPLITPLLRDSFILTIFIDDLIEAFYATLTTPSAIGNAYHLSAGDCPTVSEYMQAIATWAGVQPIHNDPTDTQTLLDGGFSVYAFPYAPGSPGRLNIANAQRDLGFSPTPFREALVRTLDPVSTTIRSLQMVPAWPGRTATQTRLCGIHELLHEQAEQCWYDQKKPPAVLTVDDLLKKLTQQPDALVLTDRERWLQSETCFEPTWHRYGEDDPMPVLIIPTQLTSLLLGSELSADPLPTCCYKESCQLVGVLEPVESVPDSYDCFLHQPLRNRVDYTHDNFPAKLYTVRFEHVRQLSLGEKDRAIVHGEFADWLLSRLNKQTMTDVNLDLFSKCYLADDYTAFANCLSDQRELEVLADWVHLFGLARLLIKAGHMHTHQLFIGRANHCCFTRTEPDQSVPVNGAFLDSALKVTVNNQNYLYDIASQTLCSVPKPFAILLDYVDPFMVSASLLEEIFDLDAVKAIEVYEVYRNEFVKHVKMFCKEQIIRSLVPH
ncbi:NAD-dependent epimerase/dehydratase family protein [Spirosoma montaniterrae]|uniref:NAD-dependent epimerase/dehydratase domain-containing protein n=1 Tax=Spirosoma montaniterrae TaxID=1178516 RepID=A0A1P9WW31_9BACT|nr:NAD-dependent epimerase/dehydratase family protein [Spirosoma montaniterrae]AQG79573.1 hypothetical protein AWR27_09695 [Spirosoma montaniterrae]